jgi:hypothetical protein
MPRKKKQVTAADLAVELSPSDAAELSLLALLCLNARRGDTSAPHWNEPLAAMADAPYVSAGAYLASLAPVCSRLVGDAPAQAPIVASTDLRKPSPEQRRKLIDLAIKAGGIDALRQWLDDLEQRIRRRSGRPPGSKFERLDLTLIWSAWENYRLAQPPISKHAAISRLVEANWSPSLGASEDAVIKRLERRPWPPEAASGINPEFRRN